MIHYADSSFLVSCYIPDTNSAKAKAWLVRTGSPLIFTALHNLEVRNAFKLGVFRGLLSAADAGSTWADLEMDLRAGRLIKTTVNWPVVFRVATQLSERHSVMVGTRSLDILHIAAAKTLGAVDLLSFDTRQRTLATAVGLSTSP